MAQVRSAPQSEPGVGVDVRPSDIKLLNIWNWSVERKVSCTVSVPGAVSVNVHAGSGAKSETGLIVGVHVETEQAASAEPGPVNENSYH
jgi:hypothetical protein